MNFFKSIILDDPEPENSDHSDGSEPNSPKNSSPKSQQVDDTVGDDDDASSNPNQSESNGGWSFGGFIKTISSRSESVLETYRRDLQEFGSGLKKESDLFREVGTSAIDGVLKSTAEIISHGKDALLATSDHESDASESLSSRVYSRFESQLVGIQCDVRTYCEDPEDLDDYSKWKSGFVLDDKKDEIGKLVGDDEDILEGMYKRVVPNEVNHETFWCRYFYQVYKLKQQQDMRAKLVRRSLAVDDEEELSWDVDEEDEDEAKKVEHNVMENKESGNKDFPQIENKESSNEDSKTEGEEEAKKKLEHNVMENKVSGNKDCSQIENKGSSNEESKTENVSAEKVVLLEKSGGYVSDEKVVSEIKSDEKVVDNGESCKDNDVSVVSTHPSLQEEEEPEWDEIEDLGSNDEKKASQSGSPTIVDVKKRLSAAEEVEDLSWDIEEEEDEPLKA